MKLQTSQLPPTAVQQLVSSVTPVRRYQSKTDLYISLCTIISSWLPNFHDRVVEKHHLNRLLVTHPEDYPIEETPVAIEYIEMKLKRMETEHDQANLESLSIIMQQLILMNADRPCLICDHEMQLMGNTNSNIIFAECTECPNELLIRGEHDGKPIPLYPIRTEDLRRNNLI